MMKLFLNLLVLCVVVTAGASTARSQSASTSLFNPPGWMLGGWGNLAESNLNNSERLVFTSHEIELTKGFGGKSKVVEFSRAFKDWKVRETVEPHLYRVEIYRDKHAYVYEFKLCETDACKSSSEKSALTYSITKNKKIIRTHMTSIQLVLFRLHE